MKCHVYRSAVRDGLYVYVAATDDDDGIVPADGTDPPGLAALPEPVRRQLGRTELAMTLDLEPDRKLGQEDAGEVLANLAGQGFHVQMPRDIESTVERIARESSAKEAARKTVRGAAGGTARAQDRSADG